MFGLAKKKPALPVLSPVAGTLLPLADVPDEVFSRGQVGPGFAVEPADGTILAPIGGTVVLIPEASRHTVAVRSDDDVEVLVHVGLGTVALAGEGFAARVEVGDRVEAGQVLLEVDLEAIRARVPSLVTPVVVTNAAGAEIEGPRLDAGPGEAVLEISPR
ncbi:PTS sugar transporter subunit IIA [Brachybacterium sp. DNPG3]